SDPGNLGPYSDPQSFKTPVAAAPPPPSSPGGGNCVSRLPADIVACHRALYPARLSPADAPTLLADIAHDLNKGQPPIYGRLVKPSGNNCSGFACDIICATDGNIWDVFGDGPDATINYAGVANPQWVSKGTVSPSACQVVP